MLVAQHTVYFPDAFLTQMREAMPSTLSFDDFLAACQRPLRRSIRVNTLKISVADFLQLTAPYGWTLTPIPWCEEGFWIERDNEDALPLGSTAEHLSGLFYIQEASSMLPVAALFADGNAPQRVMDVAAAPGSKTTQIAARMNNEGAILANEFSASRVKVLHANISRCGISNVALTHFDGRVFGAAVPEMFDAILLDAPCSGEGMFRKEPEMVRDWKERGPSHYSPIQRNILLQAARMLRPGGMLLYSTCTFSAEEDEGSVSWLLENDSEMRLLFLDPNVVPGSAESEILPGTLRLFPHLLRGEGHYLALLQKSGDTRNQNISQISAADELPGILCENQEVWSFLSQIPLFADAGLRLRLMETGGPKGKGRGRDRRKERLSFEETQGEVYLLPKEMPAWHSLRFLRTGLHVGSLKEGRFEPSQALAMALKKEEYPLTWNLDFEDERVLRYLRGETLLLKDEEEEMEGWILVLAGGFPLGWARGKGKTLKNKYYPGWRRM